ncbi:MAG: phosphatidate cytidylyltransferase [Actinomycetota bacterium]
MTDDQSVRVPRRGRHRRPDDDDHQITELTAIDQDTILTGRHYFPGLADLPLLGEDTPVPGPPPDGDEELRPPLAEPLPGGPAPVRSRLGRNLPAAIGVSLVLGAVIIASLLTYRPSFLVVVLVAVGYGSYELVSAAGTVKAKPPVVPLLVGGLAMDIAAWYRGPNGLVVGLLVTVCGLVVWRLADGAAGYLRDLSASILVLLYLPLLAGFAVLLAHPDDGAARVIAFIGTVVCSDTGGYAAGVLFGKHPLAPTVSKGKTWEGLVGSVLASGTCGLAIMTLTFHREWWAGALFGLAIAVTGTLGDLGESMIKRDLGLKDMGRLLPGHGGLMDRLDSLLPCAVVAYLMLSGFLDH